MRIVNAPQGSAFWLEARTGRITASRMGDVMAKRKRGDGEMACRSNYRMELVVERLTGRAEDHYVSPEMDWGSEQEKHARAAYEVTSDCMVDEVGLVLHANMDFSGASPDGLVAADGGLEIKAPKTSTHINWRLAGVVPEEHRDQMMWCMACCDRQWWDFVSFDPRLPQGLRFFVSRLERDDKRIAEMEYAVMEFNAEIEKVIRDLGKPECAAAKPLEVKQYGTETVRIGNLEVPADIAEMIGGGFTP